MDTGENKIKHMALIKCPECGNNVSDTAKSCPHCGYVITSNPTLKEQVGNLLKTSKDGITSISEQTSNIFKKKYKEVSLKVAEDKVKYWRIFLIFAKVFQWLAIFGVCICGYAGLGTRNMNGNAFWQVFLFGTLCAIVLGLPSILIQINVPDEIRQQLKEEDEVVKNDPAKRKEKDKKDDKILRICFGGIFGIMALVALIALLIDYFQ